MVGIDSYRVWVIASAATSTSSASNTCAVLRLHYRGPATLFAMSEPRHHVSSQGATLNGTVRPSCLLQLWFEYGRTVAYGDAASPTYPTGQEGIPVPVSATISGLAPDTTYHFRLFAMNLLSCRYTYTAGICSWSYSPDMTFTTLPRVSIVRIRGHKALVTRHLRAEVRLDCSSGDTACTGIVSVLRDRRSLGTAHFVLSPGAFRDVAVRLNRRGRRLTREHHRLHAVIVAQNADTVASRRVVLVRTLHR